MTFSVQLTTSRDATEESDHGPVRRQASQEPARHVIHTPGKRLMHHVPLKFVWNKVTGHGKRSPSAGAQPGELHRLPRRDRHLPALTFSASGEIAGRQDVKLPKAENVDDMIDAPMVAVNGSQILVDGMQAGTTRAVEELGPPAADRRALQHPQGQARALEAGAPDKPFPGVCILQIDSGRAGAGGEERLPDRGVRGLPERQLHGQQAPEVQRRHRVRRAPACPAMPASADNEQKPRARGLPSIQQAREGRAEGKARMPSPKFWAYAGLVLAIGFILHWKWSDGRDRAHAAEAARRPARCGRGARRRAGSPCGTASRAGSRASPRTPGPEVVDKEALAKWDFRGRAGHLPAPPRRGRADPGGRSARARATRSATRSRRA